MPKDASAPKTSKMSTMAQSMDASLSASSELRFARFAAFVLLYTIFVIVWGAFVRATGSGAGCGSDWPLCHGEVLPNAPSVEKAIEFTHRTTSGLAWFLALGLVVFARRVFADGPVRKAAYAVLFFMTTEALIGAGLVIFERVAGDTSLARGYWISGHLINTFALVTSCTLAFDFARARSLPPRLSHQHARTWVSIGALLFLAVGVSGAIAALGDTLFPAGSLIEGLRQDGDPRAHLWLRLRGFHPLLALLFSGFACLVALRTLRAEPTNSPLSRSSCWLLGAVLVQVLAGAVNLLLRAPVWMQLVHLLLSNAVLVLGTFWSRRKLVGSKVPR